MGDEKEGDVDSPGFVLFFGVAGVGTVLPWRKECSIKYISTVY